MKQQVRLLRNGTEATSQRPKYSRITDRLLVLRGRLQANEITVLQFTGAACVAPKL